MRVRRCGMRELSQLIDVEEPAWPEPREILSAGPVEACSALWGCGVERSGARPADAHVARLTRWSDQVDDVRSRQAGSPSGAVKPH